MTDLTFKILLLAIPGLFALSLYDRLNGTAKRDSKGFLLALTLFSTSAYLLRSLLQWGCHGGPTSFSNLFGGKLQPDPTEALLVTACGLAIAIVSTYANTYNWVNRLGQWINATNRYGDSDVWHFYHNMDKDADRLEWVFVRDHKLDLMYFGAIKVWSDSGLDRELILTDVTVYDNLSADEMYETDTLYLCRSKYDLSIESPTTPEVTTNGQG